MRLIKPEGETTDLNSEILRLGTIFLRKIKTELNEPLKIKDLILVLGAFLILGVVVGAKTQCERQNGIFVLGDANKPWALLAWNCYEYEKLPPIPLESPVLRNLSLVIYNLSNKKI